MTTLLSYSGCSDTALAGGAILLYGIIVTAILAFSITVNWKILAKAGEPGWACIVPFYNVYEMFKISFGNGILFLLLLVPLANVVIAIMYNFKLAKAFGKGAGFGFGLWFLPIIFLPILAFGNAEYAGVEGK